MKLAHIHNVFFIGIGGIGMSALARYMKHLGKNVSGYDRTESPITSDLVEIDIPIFFTDDVSKIGKDYLSKNETLVVYTPAVKIEENALLQYFTSNEFTVLKRAEVLGLITEDTICLAVAGTHGKTTTSSILGHILKENNIAATSFLGGIAENYQSNLILGGSKYSVVEADEFDRSFLQLHPNYSCITSVDADHLDIYNSASELVETFKEFAEITTDKLFVRKGIPIEGITYGIEDDSDYCASNITIENGAYIFDVKTPNEIYKAIKLHLAGKHNVLNTMAALAMANSIGVSLQGIAKALLSYKGVHRRFSYRIKNDDYILIDDYAHHPTEINAVYDAVREMYPNENILAVFQPHLYSRTRDFEMEFAMSLAKFDKILLLPIYPAREHPIEGINSENLAAKIKVLNKQVMMVEKEYLYNEIKKAATKLILMIGAGDIGEMVTEIQHKLIS